MSREFRLSGRVVDEQNRPVAGAEVRCVPDRKNTRTAEDGTFSFEGLPFQRCWVSAWKDDRYAWQVLVDPEQSSEPVLLRMSLGTSLIVHAHAERAPVIGAKLVLNGLERATTDASGTAIARGLAPRLYHGFLLAEGFADERLTISPHEDPGGVEERFITLRRGARIEGLALDSKGEPLADAWVWVVSSTEGTLRYDAWSKHDGRWHFYAVAGSYRLFASTRDGARSGEIQLDCDGHTPHSDLVVRLGSPSIQKVVSSVVAAAKRFVTGSQPRRIAGVVVDAAGEPVARATVLVLEASADTSGSIMYTRNSDQTDAFGRFDIADLDADEYDVIIEPPRWTSDRRERPAPHRVRTGDLDLKLALPLSGTISGRVLLDGIPLPYFGVSLTPPRVSGGSPMGVRDQDGCFKLKHVVPGTWRLALLGPGTRLKVIEDITVEPGHTVSLGDIVMERGQRVAGHVRDSSGAAVAGARVIVGRWTRIAGTEQSRLAQSFFDHFEATTDANGAYLLDGIDAHHPLSRTPQMWATHLAAGVSTIRELLPTDSAVELDLVGAGDIEGAIEGLRGGRPTAFATRGDEPQRARMAFPDKNGTFRFEDLPVGEYVVSLDVGSEQVSSENVTVVANQTTSVRITMATSSVHLTLIVPPDRGKDLQFEPTSEGAGIGGRVRGISGRGTEDRCSFDFVRPGEYRASVDGKNWRAITIAASPAEQTIDLRDTE